MLGACCMIETPRGKQYNAVKGATMENREIVEKAIEYVKTHATENDLSIEKVADNAGFSMDYFNRMFLARTGYNIMEYVRLERLKQAAKYLRRTPKKQILDTALKHGYDSSESFSRAFKKQFGVNPSEYQEMMASGQILDGDYENDIRLKVLAHEFPQFKYLNMDETIDYLLKKDPVIYAPDAVNLRTMGGGALYEGDSPDEGFVLFYGSLTHQNKLFGMIFPQSYDQIARYLKLFDPKRFMLAFKFMGDHPLISDEKTVLNRLCEAGAEFDNDHDRLAFVPERICTETLDLPSAPDGITLRELTWDDHDTITAFLNPRKLCDYSYIQWFNYALKKRDVMGNREHSILAVGIFKAEKLLGIVKGSIHQVNGVKVNLHFWIPLDESLRTAEIYRYAYQYSTNLALQKGAIAYDITHNQSHETSPEEMIDSGDCGYQTIGHYYLICRSVK